VAGQEAPPANQNRPAGAAQNGANRKADEPGGPAPVHNIDGTVEVNFTY